MTISSAPSPYCEIDALVLGAPASGRRRWRRATTSGRRACAPSGSRCRRSAPPARCRRWRRSRSPMRVLPSTTVPISGEDGEDEDLVVEAQRIGLAEREEARILRRLVAKPMVLPPVRPSDEAAADEQHGQRGDEGRHPQDRDQHAVDQADARRRARGTRRSPAQARGRDATEAKVIAEDRRRQPGGRTDREVEILVDDDEGHADGHARRSARRRAAPRTGRRPSRRSAD